MSNELKRITKPEIIDPMLAILRDPTADDSEKSMAASTIVEAIAPDIMQDAVNYLATLAAREGEDGQVTNEWLASIGGQQEVNPIKVTFNRGENQDIGLWRVDDGWKAMLIHAPHAASQMIRGLTTRGQVLALLTALQINTKENGQ